MKEFVNVIQCGFAAMGGFFGWAMGGFDGFLYALIVFVAVDYLTGLMAAAVEKKLSSAVGFRGIFKKIVIFCLVAVGHIVDMHIIQAGSALRTAVIFFYLSNVDLCQYYGQKKLKDYAVFSSSSSSFCWGVM